MNQKQKPADALWQRRFPVELADELLTALAAVRHLDHGLLFRYLEIVRAKRLLPVWPTPASGRITRLLPPHPSGVYEVPAKFLEPIVRLDAAFKRFHRYKASPGDWLAKDVDREAQRQRGLRPKQRKGTMNDDALATMSDEAYRFLDDHNYLDLERGEKGKLKERTMKWVGASADTVGKAVGRLRKDKIIKPTAGQKNTKTHKPTATTKKAKS